jgi:hypothetical protein
MRSANDPSRCGGGVPAAVDVDGTDDRLEGVGEDRALVAPPESSPLPSEQRGAEVELGATSARVTALTTPDRSFAIALGQVGVGVEDVVGHHETEHRITEELEALVGATSPFSAHQERWVRAARAARRRRSGGRCGREGIERQPRCAGRSAQPGVHVVDGVAHGLQVFEVLVVDAEADARSLSSSSRPRPARSGPGVGVEVVDERVALGDESGSISRMSARRSRIERRRPPGGRSGALFDVGLSRHDASWGWGHERQQRRSVARPRPRS